MRVETAAAAVVEAETTATTFVYDALPGLTLAFSPGGRPRQRRGALTCSRGGRGRCDLDLRRLPQRDNGVRGPAEGHPRRRFLLARRLSLRRGRAGFPSDAVACLSGGGDPRELPRRGGAARAGVGARVVQGREAVQEPHIAATQG
jgi:hypothetical protein